MIFGPSGHVHDPHSQFNFGDIKLNPDSTDNTRESGKNPKIIELLTSGKAEAVPNPLDIEDPMLLS